jgi:hypothetical protein
MPVFALLLDFFMLPFPSRLDSLDGCILPRRGVGKGRDAAFFHRARFTSVAGAAIGETHP